MAYTELQTAAIRLVHVSRPTDRDLDYLRREFHFTADDAEAVLGVSEHSVIQNNLPQYRRLTVQWPIVTRHGLELTEMHCFVGRNWLVVIDHGQWPEVVELIKELRTLPPERLWQDGPMMMLYEIWRRTIRGMNVVDQGTSVQQVSALARARVNVAEAFKSFVQSTPDPDPGMVQGWRWLSFTLTNTNPAGVRVPVAVSNRLPLTARSYAAASAAVAIATLLVINQTL